MHDNPCKGKWNLSNSPVECPHSSAKFYIEELQGAYSVANIMEMDDIVFTKRK